ncbi:MAG: acetate--CoA ligase family protein [Chloroflexota bacterium]|nr:acetate--CoA ligase family protein [Chloroflexota bacterium]
MTTERNHAISQSHNLQSSSLRAFFDPSGVAVIGASSNPQKLGFGVLRNLKSYGFRGAIYPVNPGREHILDLPCYPNVDSVPDPVELAVIILPATLCPAALEQCGRRGIRSAIVLSGGFKEVGLQGQALEEEMVRIAQTHNMRMIGPNCVGTMDAYTGLNTTFIRAMPKPGHIAFVSQSGAICGGILEWTDGKGVGFSRFATLGNEADLSESDLIAALADDPNTRVIVAYLESIRNGRRFIDVASQVTPRKPILVIKAGTTEAGTRAVSSHTGSLAGESAAYDAAFKQSGVLQVDTVEELFNSAVALVYGPLPRGNRVAIVTNAGGPASLAADELERNGLVMPAPCPDTLDKLSRHTHSDAQLANPIDMLGGATPPDFEMAIRALVADPNMDSVLAILVPQALINPAAVADAIGRATRDSDKPVVACFMGDLAVREAMARLHEYQIAPFQFPEPAVRALGKMWQYAKIQREGCQNVRMSECHEVLGNHPVGRRAESEALWRESAIARKNEAGDPRGDETIAKKLRKTGKAPRDSTSDQVTTLIERARADSHSWLGEYAARLILEAYDVPQPRAAMAHSGFEAAELAENVGFPVALKIVSPDILHKSEVDGVVLGLSDRAAVELAFEEMMAQIPRRMPDARVEGLLIAQMAAAGHEVIVGMRRDPQFGPLIMFGLGGIYVELFQDVAFRIAPFERAETLRMIGETQAGKLLQGLRGKPPGDIEAVAEVIEKVAQLALDFPDIQEIDINPLIVYARGQGALAVDARMLVT